VNENDYTIMGKPPEGTTHANVHREPTGKGTGSPALEADLEGVGALVSLHSIEALSVDAIRREWGGGRYRVRWIREHEGVRKFVGGGQAFTIQDEVVPAPTRREPAAAAPMVGGDALALVQLMRAERADAQREQTQSIATLAQLLGALGGGNRGGGGSGLDETARAQLELWQQKLLHAIQTDMMTLRAEVQAARNDAAAARAELAAFRDEFEDEEEDDSDDDEDDGRAAPETLGEAIKGNVIHGVDSGLRELVPVLGPGAVEVVEQFKRKAKADADFSEERLEQARAQRRGAPTAPPAAIQQPQTPPPAAAAE
jgi:hypothetical protein